MKAQKKACFETNIMETSMDAARDAQALAAGNEPTALLEQE